MANYLRPTRTEKIAWGSLAVSVLTFFIGIALASWGLMWFSGAAHEIDGRVPNLSFGTSWYLSLGAYLVVAGISLARADLDD